MATDRLAVAGHTYDPVLKSSTTSGDNPILIMYENSKMKWGKSIGLSYKGMSQCTISTDG
jgi:hypothetical protein